MKFRTIMISYGFIVGIMMILWWLLALFTGSIPEFQNEPFGITMHLIAEFLTAVALILGSIELKRNKPWGMGIYRVSLGMLIYTSIASSGYFMDHGEIPPVIMFLVILIITSILLVMTFRKESSGKVQLQG